tara:strand:- start:3898 stop:4914 length:1017 start_codon:yes stop_codon:yes gene_type:complete
MCTLRLLVLLPTRFLGNFVISLQAIAALVRAHDVDLLIDDRHTSLVRVALGSGFNTIAYPRSELKALGPVGQLRAFTGLVTHLRRERYDAVVDLDGTSLSSNLVALVRARRRTGPDFARHPRFYDERVAMDQATQHCFDDYAKVVEAVTGQQVERQYLKLPDVPAPTMPASIQSIPNEQRLICLHPSASKSYKEWPASRFAALSEELHARNFHVVLLGAGASERQTISHIREHSNHPLTDTHNQLDISQLTWLIQKSHLYIGNDSGPMHLAASTGTPVIALFGPTELIRWQPLSDTTTVLSHQQLCHRNCQPEACLGSYRCMSAITLEEVLTIVDTHG